MLVAVRKETIIISTKIHQSKYATSGIHLKAHQCTLIPLTVKKIFQFKQSPSGSVYTKITQKLFGFIRLFDLDMKTHVKTTRGKGLRIPTRTTGEGSSSFPWSLSEVDAALRSLSALKSGPRRRPLRPLETNLSSRFRPSLPGPRRHLLRPLETKTSPCFQPSGAEEASTTPPLRRTSRLAFGPACRG